MPPPPHHKGFECRVSTLVSGCHSHGGFALGSRQHVSGWPDNRSPLLGALPNIKLFCLCVGGAGSESAEWSWHGSRTTIRSHLRHCGRDVRHATQSELRCRHQCIRPSKGNSSHDLLQTTRMRCSECQMPEIKFVSRRGKTFGTNSYEEKT